ncbi:di-trans,poly-cis-decaprenylcistransferase [Candidatus Parcubacteria bacterium]|nr:di-trans,poly-cis-decaprenylcistransferase [Candidatus Parcubacteria bacterium]
MKDQKQEKNIPKHLAIIMDGNRRWARERNLPTYEGHLRGYEKLRLIPETFFSYGVEIVTVYAFSTENWNRAREEVNYLMKLTKKALQEDVEYFNEKEIKILLSGRIDELPGDLPNVCKEILDSTKNNNKSILNICLNYGGRAEIIDAIKKMMKKNVKLEQIHEGLIKKYLYQSELRDPDIIIRTSGENRLSGFLLWESAYSELLFIKKYWPDFEKKDVEFILNEYANRNPRFGGK